MITCRDCGKRLRSDVKNDQCMQCWDVERKRPKPCYYCAAPVAWTPKRGRRICEPCFEKHSRPVSAREGRKCYRCGQKSASSRGKPICPSCRALNLCVDCGRRHEGLKTRCEPCSVRRNANRPRILKQCKDCGRDIRSKSNTNYCGPCGRQRRKHPCMDCGTLIDPRAKRCMPCWGKAHSGEAAPQWNGGRTIMLSHGYVLVQCPEHPRANRGYMREHVIVMENTIGRRLLPGETVHHKNGVRDDNRPENLELWSGSQPSGQRVEDKAAWARELLGMYGTPDERARYACLPDTNLASA